MAPRVIAGTLAVAVLVGGVAIAVAPPGGAASPPPAVQPFPGTPDASPRTQITFPVTSAHDLRAVTVHGSRSGAHAGRLSTLPDGRGVAFVPARPFADGESVSVRAVAGGRPLRFAFGVRAPLALPPAPPPPAPAAPPATLAFRSAPDLRPPAVRIAGSDPDPAAGDIFLDAQDAPQDGPMILDRRGRLVWFAPVPSGESAFDLRVQTYRGQPVLTYWRGRVVSGHGIGEGVVLDRSYRTLATVHAAEGYSADLHELQLTPQGTALITAYVPVRADLSSVGGPRDGTVVDSVVQEIDVRTGRLLWEWHALGHLPLRASHAAPRGAAPYDPFHVNSVQQLPGGNLLISARDTWGVYEISRQTGRVLWQVGGRGSSFRMGRGTRFEWQHDARLQPDGTLTVFDNAGNPPEARQSRALSMRLDDTTMRATLLHAYTHRPPLLAGSQGDVQVLPGGDVFVGWGQAHAFSEYAPGRGQRFAGRLPGGVQSYRAYRFPWTGRPATAPSVAVTATHDRVVAYASWNGATGVARWQLLAGPAPHRLSPVGQAPRAGFETAIRARTTRRWLAVRALDAAGHVLGASAAERRGA